MNVTVVNLKSNKSTTCSMSKAAKLIGVSRLTLYNWKKKGTKETFNQFDIYFDAEVIKQNPRGVGK